MGKILATYALKVTLRQPDNIDPEAPEPPTVGTATDADPDVTSFIPTNELLSDIVASLLEQATQLSAGVTSERTDK